MKSIRMLAFSVMLVLPLSVFAQNQSTTQNQQSSPVLNALLTAFDRGDTTTKLQVLKRAQSQPAQQMIPLYSHALDYAVSNAPQVSTDNSLNEVALLTVRQIKTAGSAAELSQLWSLFQAVPDNTIRIAILDDIGTYGKGDKQTVANLNGWIEDRALSSQGGATTDRQVVLAAVVNLSNIADSSSFPAFLHVILAQLSTQITDAAQKGMFGIQGDIGSLAVSSIERLNLSEWNAAVSYLLQSSPADGATKGKIAEGVLAHAVEFRITDAAQQTAMRTVRGQLVSYLTQHPEKGAVEPLIRNFNLTVQEFGDNRTTWDRLLESIASLGATGAEAAAKRLSDYLNLLNTYTENDRQYDTRVVLAVINNIKILGYQVAYQTVYYASLLKYPDSVLHAAESTLSSLQK